MTGINNVTMNNANPNITSMTVSKAEKESKNIQNKLTSEQQRLNKVSSDEDMTTQEKEKKRREIQKQIDELNRKLRMLRMEKKEEEEQAQEEQEKKIVLKEEMIGESDTKTTDNIKEKADKDSEQEDKIQEEQKGKVKQFVSKVKDMISADLTVKADSIENNAEVQKKHTKNIKKAEIKADELYGNDTAVKRQQLSDMRTKEQINAQIRNQNTATDFVQINTGAKIIIREG